MLAHLGAMLAHLMESGQGDPDSARTFRGSEPTRAGLTLRDSVPRGVPRCPPREAARIGERSFIVYSAEAWLGLAPNRLGVAGDQTGPGSRSP